MVGGSVPALLRQGEDLTDRLAAQALATLDDGAGRYQWPLAGEHDVHPADDVPGRHAPKQGQADHTPEHGLQRQAPLAHGGYTRRLERSLDQLGIQQCPQRFEGVGSAGNLVSQRQCAGKSHKKSDAQVRHRILVSRQQRSSLKGLTDWH
ncbi:hypothetical protein D3C78_1466410 [compost metagenome]